MIIDVVTLLMTGAGRRQALVVLSPPLFTLKETLSIILPGYENKGRGKAGDGCNP